MRILLLGKNGQVGWELQRTLATLGEVKALDLPEIDLADADGVRSLVREARPEIIVNASAYTAVDRAESEAEKAMAVNGIAPGILAEEAKALGASLIHYSTDYVFDGQKRQPYVETDIPNPINVYGKTKLAGEEAVRSVGGAYLILRTSWVYSLRGDSFVNKVMRWARERDMLQMVVDQVGSPTWARMLAEITAQALVQGGRDVFEWLRTQGGIYHLAGQEPVSRYEWAQAILAYDQHPEEQIAKRVSPATSAEFRSAARRPAYSALDCGRFQLAFGLRMPHWRATLQLAMS